MNVTYFSNKMKLLKKQIDRISPTNHNILIIGPRGSEPIFIASDIHKFSGRKGSFISFNCELSETLLMSEMFGHEEGAFFGAKTRKIGLLEMASTLFLENIEAAPPGFQAALNKFLETGSFYRVGGNEAITSNARIISSSKDIESAVNKGTFREDLYYRLNAVTLYVPRLSECVEDMKNLMESYFSKSPSGTRAGRLQITPDAELLLLNHGWPGDRVQFKNMLTRLDILANHIVTSELVLQLHPEVPEFIYDPNITLYELEKQSILKSIQHFNGNKTQAAAALGITIKTLYNKLHEYGAMNL